MKGISKFFLKLNNVYRNSALDFRSFVGNRDDVTSCLIKLSQVFPLVFPPMM